MKRLRETIWPWADNARFGFTPELVIKQPRQGAKVTSIAYVDHELRLYLEEHRDARIGRDRTFRMFPAKSHFDIPDTAEFITTVPVFGNGMACHIWEILQSSPHIAHFLRPESSNPFDPEPMPNTQSHANWLQRETLRREWAENKALVSDAPPDRGRS